jgi:hypothetical protein
MPSGLHPESAVCTQLSSPCSSSLLPFTLLLPYCILYQTLPEVTSGTSSQPSVRFRFVLSLLFPGASPSSNHSSDQVIASYLIILRVANRSALTSEAVASENVGSIRFRSAGGTTGGNETLPDGHAMSFVETSGEASGELGIGVETGSPKT